MEPIKVRLRSSNRAHNLRLTVHRDKSVDLTVPHFINRETAIKFLQSKKEWIKNKLEYYSKFDIKKEDEAFYLGKLYKMNVSEGSKSEIVLKDTFNITLKTNTKLALVKALNKWYVEEAKKKITSLVNEYSSAYGYSVNRICIRKQKTRWGSCSKGRNLNFNYKLIMAPEEVIRYVVLHELTHLSEMNHSTRFWELLSNRCVNYKESRKWLKKNGPWLGV